MLILASRDDNAFVLRSPDGARIERPLLAERRLDFQAMLKTATKQRSCHDRRRAWRSTDRSRTSVIGWTSLQSSHSKPHFGRRTAAGDEQRTVTKRNAYAPYGETFAPTAIDGTGYTGHVMDQATGLTYMQQRYYDSAIGGFLSVDPVVVDTNTAENFCRYCYANNNPYSFTDPDGRNPAARGDGRDHRTTSEKVSGKFAQARITVQSRRNASSGTNPSGRSQSASDPSISAKQAVAVANADVTIASAVNLAIGYAGDAVDKSAAKAFGGVLAKAGAVGGVAEMASADTASEFGHGLVMTALIAADGTPLAPAAATVQVVDLALQLAPAYESKAGFGSANGWTGAGLMVIDGAAAAAVPAHPMMRGPLE